MEEMMRFHGSRVAGFLIVAAGLLLLGSMQSVQTEQAGARVEIDSDDIGGVVTGPDGPEAGVWVIAETTDLPTKFSRSVVTDDQGRYVIPDLPAAGYQVWVRGYGLVDSPSQSANPGQSLDLQAVPAPTEAAAAEYYPAAYWLALMDKPLAGCGLACHQIGNKATREIPVSIREKTATSLEAWDMRVGNRARGRIDGVGLQRSGRRSRGVRGLDGSHRGRRDPARQAAAAGGVGAEPGRHGI
jgi:hypothetical protein